MGKQTLNLADHVGVFTLPHLVLDINFISGNITDFTAAYDAMIALRRATRITTKFAGYGGVGSVVLMQGADNGSREITEQALGLIASTGCSAIDDEIACIFADSSGKHGYDFFAGIMQSNHGQGTWYSAAELVDMGLADVIIPKN